MASPQNANSQKKSGEALVAPSISLPKGGGAIRGMGEKFAANPVTGTGSMTIPIATSPGRSGFGPQLSLSYDSGSGNGPFGFGWSLSLPSISRKTDKGLPRYIDAEESDVFILFGSEDLVPVFRQDKGGDWIANNQEYHLDNEGIWVLDKAGRHVVHEDQFDSYQVRRFRPRIEGLFARIERWTKIGSPSDVHWRSISRDNIVTLYGSDENSRIADPDDTSRIFSWLICESRDDKGNGIRYLYKPEDGNARLRPDQSNPFEQVHQANRGDAADLSRTTQRYLQKVLYGNRRSLLNAEGQRPRHLSDLPDPPVDGESDWLFEVRFDYGELNENDPTGQPETPWLYRTDAFSSYRSGFEVRTCRRCERVLMLNHIPDQPVSPERAAQAGYQGIVRSTEFTYDDELDPNLATRPVYSFLKQVVQTGWNQGGGATKRRSLPPVEFEYSQPVVQDKVEEVDPQSLDNLPIGLDGGTYHWTDLHGEGIPGILTEQAGAWFYKRNISSIPTEMPEGREVVKAKFAPLETVTLKPNVALSGGAEFMDLAGDGQPDVVVMDGPMPGLYEHDEAEGWKPFRPFASHLNLDMRDPNVKLVDLDGDGHADVLITEDDAFVWCASLAEEGFGPAQRVAQALDEEKGPRVVFADGTESIYLADLSGDGLTDICRIRNTGNGNGEVCYWPNLGYCRFGAKVTMDNAPWLDNKDQFDYKRIRLADIDGSGTTDIIYLHRDGVRLYFNQSGNSWSKPQQLKVFPRIDELVNIVPIDLLGNGTAFLVWSSPLPGDAGRQMRYVDLMGGKKPHLLEKTDNNLGAETCIEYAPSTKFYLLDKRDGKPWITRLPFPVHVVEKVATYDHVSRNQFVTRYAYHHGYFDGEEREFRGFGMVEQWDAEQFDTLMDAGALSDNIAPESHVPPVRTKTWFHTGVHLGGEQVSRHFESEYFRAPAMNVDTARPLLLDDTIVPPDLTLQEEREACRALKGSMLRHEVYADDAGHGATPEQIKRAQTPYTVTEQNLTIRSMQPQGRNRHPVFLTHACETINNQYERNPADPRISHELILAVDEFGNVLKQSAIAYGRREQIKVVDEAGNTKEIPNPELGGLDLGDRKKQTRRLITYSEHSFSNVIDEKDNYRTPLPSETRTYELTGIAPKNDAERFPFGEWTRENFLLVTAAEPIDYEKTASDAAPQKRLIERLRNMYRPDDLGASQNDPLALLPLGTVEALALPGETYQLAFTPGLLTSIFKRPLNVIPPPGAAQPEVLLPDLPNRATIMAVGHLDEQAADRGGYVDLDGDGHWWIPSGRTFYSPKSNSSAGNEANHAHKHFFLPRRFRDPFHCASNKTETQVDYDAYDLLLVSTLDPLANTVTARNDYRVLQADLMTDPNRNRSEVRFDALGFVAGTAVMGKSVENLGDSLEDFAADLPQVDIEGFHDAHDPRQLAQDLLGGATTRIIYDLYCFQKTRKENPNDAKEWQPAYVSTLARETHLHDQPPPDGLKIQINFSYSDGLGREIQKKIQAEPGSLVEGGEEISPRWVSSGWTIFNNKGKPVRQFEPFFSKRERNDGKLFSDHRFEFGVTFGVSPVLFYDPVERLVATLHPNHTYEKTVFDPWREEAWDVNDTVLTDPANDQHVGAFFRRLPKANYLPTWHALRKDQTHNIAFAEQYPDPGDRTREASAAEKTAAHAATQTVSHFDTLGRTFLTVVNNKVVCPDHERDGKKEKLETRLELDIEGNQLEVRDAKDRLVMKYHYHMAGPSEVEEEEEGKTTNRIHQASMEAGERWVLNDVAGNSMRAWDSRGHAFQTEYDELRRPVRSFVIGADQNKPTRKILFDRTVYGEAHPDSQPSPSGSPALRKLNLCGEVFMQFDRAGVVLKIGNNPKTNQFEGYDFKGNALRSTRRLAREYEKIGDWSILEPLLDTKRLVLATTNAALVPLVEDGYTTSTTHDALDRPVTLTSTDKSVIWYIYNEANLLESVKANLHGEIHDGELVWTSFVTNIDYDSIGQRKKINYGNGANTFYDYDPLTFRLVRLRTVRGKKDTLDCNPVLEPRTCEDSPAVCARLFSNKCILQDLNYTYDPSGNIVHIRDSAQQTIYFKKKRVEPSNDYTYDAIYQLIGATGREHLGQIGGSPIPHSHKDAKRVGLAHPGDGRAMGTYRELYHYDEVGNFREMAHHPTDGGNGGWSRKYSYAEESLLEPATQKSNRLTSTTVSGTTEVYSTNGDGYDSHGNMLRMPHLRAMQWGFEDQLQCLDLGGGGTAYYVYDVSGERVRKVIKRQNGTLKEERIYLGGFEIYKKYGGSGDSQTLRRETLHVMDDKQRIALIETRTHGDDGSAEKLTRYQFSNHLGSASAELNEKALIISYEEYSPYGSTVYQAMDKNLKASAKRYRYTGKERDEESGISYHKARYFTPWLGRWLSCDPIGIGPAQNLYEYVQNNPVNNIDPDGTENRKPLLSRIRQRINAKGGRIARVILEFWQQTLAPPSPTSPLSKDPAQLAKEAFKQGKPAIEKVIGRRLRFPGARSTSELVNFMSAEQRAKSAREIFEGEKALTNRVNEFVEEGKSKTATRGIKGGSRSVDLKLDKSGNRSVDVRLGKLDRIKGPKGGGSLILLLPMAIDVLKERHKAYREYWGGDERMKDISDKHGKKVRNWFRMTFSKGKDIREAPSFWTTKTVREEIDSHYLHGLNSKEITRAQLRTMCSYAGDVSTSSSKIRRACALD